MLKRLPRNALGPKQSRHFRRRFAVDQKLGGIGLPDQFFHAPQQPMEGVLVDKTADGADGYGSLWGDAVEAPAETLLIRPARRRDGAEALVLEPCGQKLIAVVVPVLDWGGEVGVQGKVRPDDQHWNRASAATYRSGCRQKRSNW